MEEEDDFILVDSEDEDGDVSYNPNHEMLNPVKTQSARISMRCMRPSEAHQWFQDELQKVASMAEALVDPRLVRRSPPGIGVNYLDPVLHSGLLAKFMCKAEWRCDSVLEFFCDNLPKAFKDIGAEVNDLIQGRAWQQAAEAESRQLGGSVQPSSSALFECPILCIEVPYGKTRMMGCGHRFSTDAWEGHLDARLIAGDTVGVRCMACKEVIPAELPEDIYTHAPDKLTKWKGRELDHFIRACPNFRNCPGADCQRCWWYSTPPVAKIIASELPEEPGKRNIWALGYSHPIDCSCEGCLTNFCAVCSQESHYPIPCEIIRVWDQKARGEGANVSWIFVHTKNCPKCHEPIEKNQGCLHMTCRCRHEFCWVCLGNWASHRNDYYRCNRYEEQSATNGSARSEAEIAKERASKDLERYAHFYSRYLAHHQGQHAAIEALNLAKERFYDTTTDDPLEATMAGATPTKMPLPQSPGGCVTQVTAGSRPSEGNQRGRIPPTKKARAALTLKAKGTSKSVIEVGSLLEPHSAEALRLAIEEVIRGRRILKWTYAFGYYAMWRRSPSSQGLYEHQQGQLEWTLDKLQELIEEFDFDNLLLLTSVSKDDPMGAFAVYKRDTADLTRVVSDFFQRMLEAFENEIVPIGCPDQIPVVENFQIPGSHVDGNNRSE